MIETIGDLQRLVRDDFTDWQSLGDVKAVYKDGLVLFGYTAKAQYVGRWNAFERMSRGLILDATSGEIVARPFDKFFNWGERGQISDAPIVSVTEKMDGSLGISYRDTDGMLRIATRGSFDSDQAQWATRWLHERYTRDGRDSWPWGWTLLFEIIYPANRIVIDYGQRGELVLLAIRQTVSGRYLDQGVVDSFASAWGLARPRNIVAASPAELSAACAVLPASDEGYVAMFADGQLFKFKGAAYCQLHKLISGISFSSALEAVATGQVAAFRERVPDEFLGEWNGWVAEIETTAAEIKERTEALYQIAPKGNRREYAQYVMAHAPALSSYAFLRLDGKPLEPVIYRQAFRDRTTGETACVVL